MNHETSKVPFPYNTTAPTAANGENDFDNAQVSRLILNQHSAGVLNGSFVIASSSGYQRFCSNYLATSEGGVRPGDPLHERGVAGLRVPPGGLLAARRSGSPAEQRGRRSSSRSTSRPASTTRSTGWAGTTTRTTSRSPGIGHPVVLSGDDTFTSGPLTDPLDTSAQARAGPVAALLLHRTEHGRAARRRGRPLGVRLRHAGRQELLRRRPRVGDRRHRALHQGAEGHRHRPQPRRLGAEGRRQGLPAAADERQLADRPSLATAVRSASTARSGCSSTGATSTTCSSSSASRTSPTTSGRAWRTSSTSSTRAGAGRPRRASTRRTSGRRTAASGRWCSTRTTRRR